MKTKNTGENKPEKNVSHEYLLYMHRKRIIHIMKHGALSRQERLSN